MDSASKQLRFPPQNQTQQGGCLGQVNYATGQRCRNMLVNCDFHMTASRTID